MKKFILMLVIAFSGLFVSCTADGVGESTNPVGESTNPVIPIVSIENTVIIENSHGLNEEKVRIYVTRYNEAHNVIEGFAKLLIPNEFIDNNETFMLSISYVKTFNSGQIAINIEVESSDKIDLSFNGQKFTASAKLGNNGKYYIDFGKEFKNGILQP